MTTAIIALVVLGISLGAVIGVGMSQAFDKLDIEKRVRDFSNPAAASAVQGR